MGDSRRLLSAFRRQVRFMIKNDRDPWSLMVMWDGNADTDRDELIDILKQETGSHDHC